MSSANTQAYVELLKKRINRGIARLREIAVEPVDITFAENLSFEVRPKTYGDDRMYVFRKDWGGVSVNYTQEGVIVDLFPEDSLNFIGTLTAFKDDLVAE